MRVTDAGMYNEMKRGLLAARERAVEAQATASTGVRVNKPSDDPTAAAQARLQHSRDALAKSGATMAGQAIDRLQSADSALNSANDAIARARQLAIQGASETLTAAERNDISEEVKQIRAQMINLGNTQVAGQYVFAGNADGAPPFSATGAFTGTAASRSLQVFPGVTAKATLEGGKAFGVGTGNDVFQALDALATALQSNDPGAARASLTDLDAAADRITNGRSEAGSMMDALDVAASVASRYSTDAKLSLNELINVDEVSAATDLMRASTAYNQALAAAQQIPMSGLVTQAR